MTNSIGTSLAPHLMRIDRQVNAIDRRLFELNEEIERRGGAAEALNYVPPERPQITFETGKISSQEKASDVARRIAASMLENHNGPVSHAELVAAVTVKLNEVSASYASSFKKNPNRILERIPNIRKYKDGSWAIRSHQ